MTLNIIHLPGRVDRMKLLLKELAQQHIVDYKIWEGIVNDSIVEQGISQAHKRIVKFAQENSLPEVLIAEDDLKFTDKGAFDFFLENRPSDFDLYLSSIYFGQLGENNSVNDFSGLTFYIVKERFYRTFLSIPEHDNLDRLMKNKGRFIVCNPFAVIQQNGFSDNAKRYCNYNSYLATRKLFKYENS